MTVTDKDININISDQEDDIKSVSMARLYCDNVHNPTVRKLMMQMGSPRSVFCPLKSFDLHSAPWFLSHTYLNWKWHASTTHC